MAEGKGSLKFRLLNMRSDYIFVIFRNGLEKPIAAALSNKYAANTGGESGAV